MAGFLQRERIVAVLGYGFVGGIGLGIGYISPVSTLIKWFPDRPGLSTGIAIMGFGGGALIASPLTNQLLSAFGGSGATPDPDGIAQTFLVMGLIYAVFMSVGWLLIRVPAPDWKPAGWDPAHARTGTLITTANVSARSAIRTPQFWLLWVVLCFNVTAGIGILERAAPIYSDFFPDATSPQALAAAAAGFVAMLSLANSVGRILWSSTSDFLGRKNMYRIYLGVGALLYLALTLLTNTNKVLFLLIAILLLSFYGAGFATVPAYLRDLFGTYQVGAIHGAPAHRLVDGRCARAGDRQRDRGRADRGRGRGPGAVHRVIHDHGRAAGRRVRLQRADPTGVRALPRAGVGEGGSDEGGGAPMSSHTEADRPISPALMILVWLWVLVPFCYGLYQLVIKIPALFGH